MAPFAVVFGLLLVALGGWGYLGAEEEHRSVTALIPAFLGIALVGLGALAFRESLRKHAMHAAAALGLLGLLAASVRLVMALSGGKSLEERGPQALAGMAVLCLLFVALCVRSFVKARLEQAARRQEAAGKPGPPA